MLEPILPTSDYPLPTTAAPTLWPTTDEAFAPPATTPASVRPANEPPPLSPPSSPPASAPGRVLSILGVRICDTSRAAALRLLSAALEGSSARPVLTYFVNAHTLNLAAADPEYRRVLNRADYVFGDGTGVRWAARFQGVRVCDNLCGTDLIPQLLAANAGRGGRLFLLGGDEALIDAAARRAAELFPGWAVVGRHHGYLDAAGSLDAVAAINAAQPHLLLVGMGNPRQERWLAEHRDRLRVPLCAAVGGLFHYWAGDLRRAPRWLRRLGAEWLGILVQQPHKARRYVLGNPLFLWRIARQWLADRLGRRRLSAQ